MIGKHMKHQDPFLGKRQSPKERERIFEQALQAARLPTRTVQLVRGAGRYQFAYLKALTGKATPRQAIKSKCLECSCWQRMEVPRCTTRGCPLWAFRETSAEAQEASLLDESRGFDEDLPLDGP